MKNRFIIIAIALTFVSQHLYAKNTKTVEFKTFGISIDKPNGWFDVSAEDYSEHLKNIKTNDDEFTDLIKKHATIPFFAITKYKEPHDDLNPSIKINIKPAGNLDLSKPDMILKSITSVLESKFLNYKIIDEPKIVTINGKTCSFARFSYTLKIDEELSFETTSALWILPHNNQFFMIGAGFRTDEKNGKFEEIKKIINSIKLF
ncbi:hypothetical protein [Leptospira kanakyensis]|uniref:DUF1795 domain-containing protein n=1 Tax=Leptospira kanakyensis TaxID=2484968 RepID=A0A6N4QLI5_9LEPT|nr:hypothetical protein [Leptospira kanakyensis]MCW7468291.1 hypothetical protein [Leptospira kanakyensis]TGK55370.1 hypothetical protein EHQ11_00570 [Leptospira kanakyensis]TGK60904.1 hypothetical protein EHQ16_08395 [Leptospira kanakyensis]TGK76621.1 hypothetical protein EHQ18_01255 [Leptospira kanakyensis]